MSELELTVTIEEGDVLLFNDVWWSVEESSDAMAGIDMKPFNTGKVRNFTREELEERMEFSGEFHLIREDYRNVIDY
jgi:hypothetical protein